LYVVEPDKRTVSQDQKNGANKTRWQQITTNTESDDDEDDEERRT
jgi:hypothetical protein